MARSSPSGYRLPRRRRVRRAFTLAELAVSVTITAIVIGGSISAILIASHALPSKSTSPVATVRVSELAQRITEELAGAIHISEITRDSVVFTVADRDGDGSPERVAYVRRESEDGETEILTRRLNDGAEVEILEELSRFDVIYDTVSENEEYTGLPELSEDVELSSFYSEYGISYDRVMYDKWWAQYFKPRLPADTLYWKVSSVYLILERASDYANDTHVQLLGVGSDGLPTTTVYDEVVIPQMSLPRDWVWWQVVFSGNVPLEPRTPYYLALVTGDYQSAKFIFKSGSVSVPDSGLLEGDPGWKSDLMEDKSFLYYLYGSYATPGPPLYITHEYMTGFSLTLATKDDATRVESAAAALNTPERLSGFWKADFSVDPTSLDINGDGEDDWVVRGGAGFDETSLSDGVWDVDATLATYPDCDFDEPTIVEARFRNTSLGGDGAVLALNVDWGGSKAGAIIAQLMLQADGSQTFALSTRSSSATKVRLKTVQGLSAGFIDVRLLIDPENEAVNCKLGGIDLGTFAYVRFTPSNSDKFASISTSGSSAEFDSIEIRVGGAASAAPDGGPGGDNNPPKAVAAADPRVVLADQIVKFMAYGCSDIDKDTLTYEWDFGDGSFATGVTATHSYDEVGAYLVELTVSDGNGGVDVDTLIIRVEER